MTAEEAAAFAAARIGGEVSVSIELRDDPTTVVYDRERKNGASHGNAVAAAKRHLGQIKKNQDDVERELVKLHARIVFKTHKAFNGFGAYVPADAIEAIRNLDGVKDVHPLIPQTQENSGSVPFIGTVAAWASGFGNNTGTGIKVGIIDSGIDYIHTNMGGPGSGYGANNTTAIGDTAGVFPGTKVVGGWDFAGDNYDAGSTTPANRVPQPDPDPIDCNANGHGSHVAGTVAGLGVRTDGTTFTGPYDGSTPFGTLKIGPGVAPGAQLYALRVFGCGGSTTLTTAAIDWAVDPNDDEDFSDHLDVINMSLGAAFGSATDSSATASQNAALAGVLVVVAAGNNGDTHYTVGSPGTATRAITVAAMQDTGYQGIIVNAPASLAGIKPVGVAGTGWGAGAYLTDPGVTAQVVATVPVNGCSAITNISQVAGKIAFIDRGGTLPDGTSCGFENKAKNAQNAGAVGVIIGSVASSNNPETPTNMATATPPLGASIPAVQMPLTGANAFRALLSSGTINVTLLRSATASLPLVGDTGASFSSRGIRRGDNMLKPDISAPGVGTSSTAMGTGTEPSEKSGTSMATPHMAGVMALMRQLHPTWTVEELKALVMNTAAHDVFSGNGQTGPRWGSARAGAGRVNAGSASAASVIAMNDAADGSVSVSFGDVQVPVSGSFAGTKTIKVVNKGTSTQSFNLSISNTQAMVGTSYSLPGGSSITVPGGGVATFQVQLNATGSALKHPIDTTSTLTQTNTSGTVLNRTFLTEPTANVVLTPVSGGPTLRVPTHAIVRPTSAMGTSQSSLLWDAASGAKTLSLAGTTVNNGATQTDARAIVFPLEHVANSADLGSSNAARRAADLKTVGIYSTVKTNGVASTSSNVYFGISTYGKWTTLFDVEFDIYIDRNRDGVDDVVFFNTTQVNGSNRLDVHGTSVLALPSLASVPGSVFAFTNGNSPGIDTVQYNTNVVVLPARSVDLGLAGATPFNWRVQSFARGISGMIDSASGTYDPVKPGFVVGTGASAPLFVDSPSNLTLNYVRADFNANNSKGVLLFHFHNADGAHDQAVPAAGPSATSTTVSSAAGQYSDAVTLTATVAPNTVALQPIAGSVAFTVNGSPVGSAAVNSSGVAALPYTITLPAGSYSIGAAFTSSSGFFLNSGGTSTLAVSREDATVVPSSSNPSSVQVSSPGGTASSITLNATVVEAADGSLGNTNNAIVTVTLTPVGPGSTLSQVLVGGAATFTNVPVNVYDVTYSISGGYYAGPSAGAVLAVFDPSLGNVTGGGTVIRDGIRASFGINVKYLKNGNAQGQFLFIEHRPTGDVKVKSSAVDTLSIAGNTAILLGKAVVGEVGNYQFRLTVVDNGEPGTSDRLGLTVTKGNTTAVDFAPVTLSGGNIQVPQP